VKDVGLHRKINDVNAAAFDYSDNWQYNLKLNSSNFKYAINCAFLINIII
jgi:hypothetical protein